MTVNINAGNTSSVRLVEQASVSAPSGSAARVYVNNAARRRLCIVDSDGVTTFIGNTSGSGTGITFPATQDASSDANTLDDYEEGTWTPVIQGSGTAGTGTYTLQNGAYTKIGRLVVQTFALTWTAHTGTGNMQIGNLLFGAGANGRAGAYVTYVSNILLTAGNYVSGLYMNFSTSLVEVYQSPTGGGAATLVPMDSAGSLHGVIITFTN